MGVQLASYLFAIGVGVVSSGLIAGLWALAFDEELRLGRLLDPDPGLLTPLRALAIVFTAPTTVLIEAFWWLIARPPVGVLLLASGLIWSFFQGVFILTQIFALS